MKEIVSLASNITLAQCSDEKLHGVIELIILCSEPTYKPDGGSGVVKIRELSETRLSTVPQFLRRIAERMIEIADEADALAGRATLAPEVE